MWRTFCTPGDVVELRLEPANPFDNDAAAISAGAACNWTM